MAALRHTARRRLLNALFAVAMTTALLVVVEVACRFFVDDEWLQTELGNPLSVTTVRTETVERQEVIDGLRGASAADPAADVFDGPQRTRLDPTPRAPGIERWFVLGGSAARGWLVDPERWPAKILSRQLDGVEVINAAVPAWTSRQVMDQALKVIWRHDPTGLIVYSGNNEFIGWSYPHRPRVLGVDVGFLTPLLAHSKAYLGLARFVRGVRNRRILEPRDDTYFAKRSLIDDGFCALHPWSGEDGFDRAAWREIKERFVAQTLTHFDLIAEQAAVEGVRVVFCTVPINPTLPPCYYLPQPASLDPDRRGAVADELRAAWGAYGAGDFESAARRFRRATEVDPESALALNGLGMSLLQRGGLDEGLAALYAAREHTIGYLGALMSLNEGIRRMDGVRGVTVVDLQARFRETYRTARDVLDGNLIFDYCHPDERGNKIIADAWAEAIREADSN